MTDWSMLKKLIWLHIVKGGGGIERTVKGAIVHVINALARPAISVKCEVNPIQDLHGYDSPWPAGGGKNKLAFPYAEDTKTNNGVTFTVNDDGTVRINGTATARGVFYLQNDVSNFHPDAGTYYVSKGSECQSATIIVEAYNGTTWKKNLATVATAVSVQFTIDYDGYDRVSSYISVSSGNSPRNEIVKPMFRLSSVSDDTFSPYSNICPISGHTDADVTRTGKNIVNITAVNSSAVGISWTMNSDGTVTADGTASAFAGKLIADVDLKADVTYHLSGGVSGKSNFYLYKSGLGSLCTDTGRGANYTPANDIDGVNVYFSVNRGVTVDNLTLYPQIEVGNSGSEWEAYQGQTYTIDLDGTRYGGTLDVTTGKLTVDRTMIDLGSFDWSKSSETNGGFYATNAFYYRWASDTKMLCSRYKFDGVRVNAPHFGDNGTLTYYFRSVQPVFEIYIKDESLADKTASEFKTEMSGVQLVYELATPIEITLTPTQIDMLLGTNNLWADAGDSTLTYYAEGEASTSEALGILLGGTYNNPGGADDASDDEALGILLGGS